jgi:hypothetical protein
MNSVRIAPRSLTGPFPFHYHADVDAFLLGALSTGKIPPLVCHRCTAGAFFFTTAGKEVTVSRHRRSSFDLERQSRLSPERDARSAQSPIRSSSVAQAARDRLAGSSYPALRALRCSFHEGVLTLRGRVPSYHLRQVAWKLVGELPGVEQFVDRLVVVDGPDETFDGP